jgi:hypothetical protein
MVYGGWLSLLSAVHFLRSNMSFRFYSNLVSQASKNIAGGIFTLGLFLIGVAFLIFVLKDLFAFLAAGIFFIAGLGCAGTAIKIFFAQRRFEKQNREPEVYRENVRIRGDEDSDSN